MCDAIYMCAYNLIQQPTCAVAQHPLLPGTLYLLQCFVVTLLKVLVLFEKGGLPFHFALCSANYVAGPSLQLSYPATTHLLQFSF